MSEQIQNGTTTAHGKTWPMYERDSYVVTIGNIETDSSASAEAVVAELQPLLDKYGITAQVEHVLVVAMSPEDQAEKNALDEAAIRH